MGKKISHHKYSIIGLVIAITGYVITVKYDLDISEKIDSFLLGFENFEIDELYIWLKVLILFVILNFIVMIEKRKNAEKRKIYGSMLYASNHILKNFLYQTQILQFEAESNETFDKKMIKMYLESRDEAEILIRKLSEIENIEDSDIYDAIKAEKSNQIITTRDSIYA